MTISEFIESIAHTKSFSVEVKYAHPTLYILCVASVFEGVTTDSRFISFCESVGLSEDEVASIVASPMIELALLTEAERQEFFSFLDSSNTGTSWLSAFNPASKTTIARPDPLAGQVDQVGNSSLGKRTAKAVHFYGYKGGQGRSTVLVALAKVLADSGYRVLTVDADIEAPSLDAMFGVAAADVDSTLMGLATPGMNLTPLSRTYVGASVTGFVDLVPARPVAARFDMDFAAFLLNASLDASVLRLAVTALRQHIDEGPNSSSLNYDVVLFDHRTGLAPSVLPIMEAWPGPAVIFVRPDGMAPHIKDSRLLDTLLAHDPESPGAFVSFSLDPKKTAKDTRSQSARFIDGLLSKIADAMQLDDGEEVDSQELDPYWVFWKHDQNFVDGLQPNPRDMSRTSLDAIGQLRSVLGLSGNHSAQIQQITLTSSGSTDDGAFILTPGLAKLFSAETPYTYIFGRKGTGKTRLLSEFVRRDLAEPLLVANDSRDGGLPSATPLFQSALAVCGRDFERFWWLLLSVALSIPNTKGEGVFEDALKRQIDLLSNDPKLITDFDSQIASSNGKKRVFVIDGVETAVPASDLRSFVEALFRFLAAVQYDRAYSRLVTVRLLLRSDLVTGAAENVEQQIEGLALYLHWNKTAILNFALARIISLQWFQQNFPEVCRRIQERADSISRGVLPDDDSESLLLEIFPAGLERNRLKTTTFFSTYFSDAGGETGTDSAFYPRLFDGFLRTLADNASEGGELVDGRLSSKSVLLAYDQASKSFISDVRTELYSFINIEPNIDANRSAVDRLIAAFDGLQTPFSTEGIIKALGEKTAIPADVIRRSLASMQKIGMFESRLGYPGELRARQLYKAGLGMKYVRKKIQE